MKKKVDIRVPDVNCKELTFSRKKTLSKFWQLETLN